MNVWLLFASGHTGTGVHEVVRGPFAGVRLGAVGIADGLTGELVAQLVPAVQGTPRWVVDGFGTFENVVIQSGGFESPWGTRGR